MGLSVSYPFKGSPTPNSVPHPSRHCVNGEFTAGVRLLVDKYLKRKGQCVRFTVNVGDQLKEYPLLNKIFEPVHYIRTSGHQAVRCTQNGLFEFRLIWEGGREGEREKEGGDGRRGGRERGRERGTGEGEE